MEETLAANGAQASLPGWAKAIISLAIGGHLIAIAGMVLAAPSGPWPTEQGSDFASAPQFAQAINSAAVPYLSAIKMTHNYHFMENFPGNHPFAATTSRFEVRLRDKDGKETAVLHFPDPNASSAVRHRQQLLSDRLNDDEQLQPRDGEFVPAPNQAVRTFPFWEMAANQQMRVGTIEEHLIPRDRPVFRPSDWSLIIARSYARHLCRMHGAHSAEIVRRSRMLIPPDVLFMEPPPAPGNFEESVFNFGVFQAR